MEPSDAKYRQSPVALDPRARSVAPGRNIRLKLFYQLLPAISTHFRRRRMASFTRIMMPRPGTRILDLGGAPAIWEHVSIPLNITLLNLPGAVKKGEFQLLQALGLRHHTFDIVEGDACDVTQYGDGAFDIVFSNSVIEHVGPEPKQAEFAREVRRLGKSYWVQTPSKWFPIEAHSGLPFYWFYPEWMREKILSSWRRRLPMWWADYISTTRVLSRSRMKELFPDGAARVELFLGFPKSYTSYRTVGEPLNSA